MFKVILVLLGLSAVALQLEEARAGQPVSGETSARLTEGLAARPAQQVPGDPREDGWAFAASLRLRWEYLADSFRLVAPAVDQLYLARLQLGLAYRFADWSVELEVQDSRAWGAESLTPLGNDDVNVLEPINVKVGKRWQGAGPGVLDLSVGRMTLDYGSRRLLARNGFRNNSNAFQAVHLSYQLGTAESQLFYSYPLQREPSNLNREALGDNDFALDKAGRSERFWGLMHDYRSSQAGHLASAYLFGSQSSDRPGQPVADRDLLTAGVRGHLEGARYDLEAEAAYQWGTSLASALSAPGPGLDHRAWFTHVHFGVQASPALNIRLSYDHATGDKDPLDGSNERFDRLYGARAFELGPSGIFGAAIRSNLRSPGLRLQWQSDKGQSWLLEHRWLRLDSARDALITAGRVDPSGRSGRDLGRQWELRWRWRPPEAGIDFEIGGAYLQKGRFFAGSNPTALLNPADSNDSRYLFLQLTRDW